MKFKFKKKIQKLFLLLKEKRPENFCDIFEDQSSKKNWTSEPNEGPPLWFNNNRKQDSFEIGFNDRATTTNEIGTKLGRVEGPDSIIGEEAS